MGESGAGRLCAPRRGQALVDSTAATSVPEFIMLKKVMTGKLLALFAAYLFAYFVLCGWTLNLFY